MCYQHHRTDVFDLGALVRVRGRGGFAITVLEHRRLRFLARVWFAQVEEYKIRTCHEDLTMFAKPLIA